ncbi:MAG: potassium/proton antiporter [Cytophagaceae bacterium]|nr:potassium/proton antiporter [Cytophagaceae bacterium]
MYIDTLLLSLSLLIIISILISRFTKNIGVPVLLLFIGVGMLAGSEGPGGIEFDDPRVAQSVGIIALILILFSGGLDTKWKYVRPSIKSAISLSTLGVFITTFSIGIFVYYVFKLPFLVSLLFGAVVSSTDAAAVFSILSFRNLNLKGEVKPLLELESGSNDPMAVFLTISIIQLITIQETSYFSLALFFIIQMGLGFLIGAIGGRLTVFLINKLKFPIDGFYMVFALACAFLIYGLAAALHGSGFLAIYVAGIIVSNNEIVHKKMLFRFFDGLAWLAQIGMFISLGLLVFPSKIEAIMPTGIIISLFLIFIARPLGVFISLSKSQFNFKEKLLVSWVGLRGAVPIILATFPLLHGIKKADWIFNVVFFIVLTSALIQGWTIPWIAKLLKLDAPPENKFSSPIEFSSTNQLNMKLLNLSVLDKAPIVKKSLVEIEPLKGSLVVMISRRGDYFVPSGGTVLEQGDIIQVLTPNEKITELKDYFKEEKKV